MLRQLVVLLLLLDSTFANTFCKQGYDQFGDWCYRFDLSKLANYEEALKNCKNSQDDLVSIHDDETNNFIQNVNADGVLIGLRYEDSAQKLVWSDGTSFDYDSLDPNFMQWRDYFGECAINVDGVWKNAECVSAKYVFVCRKKAESTPNVTNSECPDQSKIYLAPVTILSPGYPQKYDLSEETKYCVYKIAAKNDHYIKISFDELDFDGGDGLFYVYEGWNSKITYAQADIDFNGLNVIVENNLAVLRLLGSLSGRWKITVTEVSAEPEPSPTPSDVCPDKNRVYMVPGTILSPGYPNNFNVPIPSGGVQCRYLIAAKNDAAIRLHFTSLYSSDDNGWLYAFNKFTDAIAFQNAYAIYNNDDNGRMLYGQSSHIGIVMHNRSPGTFIIDYSE